MNTRTNEINRFSILPRGSAESTQARGLRMGAIGTSRGGKLAGQILALSLFALTAAPASADFVFNLDTGNAAISGYAGPYASVGVNLTSATTATITFTGLNNGSQQFLFGGTSSVGVNVNGDFTVSNILGTSTGIGFDAWSCANSGCVSSGNVNGFGGFDLTIDSFDGFKHAVGTLSFVLTNTSGTWASDVEVLDPNANNALAAAHIFVTGYPANQANRALATGYAAGNGTVLPPSDVPEPATLSLLGLALLGLGAYRRKSV